MSVILTSDSLQNERAYIDEITVTLKTKYKLLTSKDLRINHQYFLQELIETSARLHADLDDDEEEIPRLLGEQITQMVERTKEIPDENLVFAVIFKYMAQDETLYMTNGVATALFSQMDVPSVPFVLYMVHRWLQHFGNIYLDNSSEEIEIDYAPLGILIRKMPQNSFNILLGKIDVPFVGSAILTQDTSYVIRLNQATCGSPSRDGSTDCANRV
jgi:hypothetical protein